MGAQGYDGSWDTRGQDAKEKGNVEVEGGCSACDFTLWHLPCPELCPWLVWLSGLSTDLQTETMPVRFPVEAHPGWVPCWEAHQRDSHINVSLPLLLPPL